MRSLGSAEVFLRAQERSPDQLSMVCDLLGAHLAMELHLEPVDEVLGGLVVRVEDQAFVAEANQLDVLHLKEEASGGRPALGQKTLLKTKRNTPWKERRMASFACSIVR